uniref:RecQ-mediated genome instability protein 2 n=1 Tax=Kalanchoe fedtschenkoi TaxID=63787 RepID=A0A7N0VCX4_KALFE
MDYSLAAPKLLCAQLKEARQTSSQNVMSLGGILFQRAWLQGVLVSASGEDGRLILDDGTGVIALNISGEFRQRQWRAGMYVMVVGAYLMRPAEPPAIKVQVEQAQTPFYGMVCSMIEICS